MLKKETSQVILDQISDKEYKKTMKDFLQYICYADSEGECVDTELERLVYDQKMSISDAIIEIKKNSDYRRYFDNHSKRTMKIKKDEIENALERLDIKSKKEAIKKAQINLQKVKSGWHDAITFIKMFMERALVDEKDSEAVAKAVYQWMWQIKRRLYGMQVKDHISIGFINSGLGEGGQGSGKTTFVQNFLKPIFAGLIEHEKEHIYACTTLAELTDPKAWSDILSKYVIFLDDISPESKHDTAVLKSILTCEGTMSSRGLYSKKLVHVKVNSSCIFTANTDNFGEIIKDKTGNRRYVPIHVKDMKCFDEDFDFSCFWDLVDPSHDMFLDQKAYVELQKKHMTKTSVELVLDQYDMKIPSKDQEKHKEVRQIFPSELKTVLNKFYPEEKRISTKNMTLTLEKLGFKKIENGGNKKNMIAYLMYISEENYGLFNENFRCSDKKSFWG